MKNSPVITIIVLFIAVLVFSWGTWDTIAHNWCMGYKGKHVCSDHFERDYNIILCIVAPLILCCLAVLSFFDKSK
jgi:uncharacterized membrane protein